MARSLPKSGESLDRVYSSELLVSNLSSQPCLNSEATMLCKGSRLFLVPLSVV
jgi:hypothetical protein